MTYHAGKGCRYYCLLYTSAYLEKIKQDALVHVLPYACITKAEASKELSDMEGLSAMGIQAFSDDGVGVATADMMQCAMRKCREVDGIIVAHTEDMRYRLPKACMHEGSRSKELVLVWQNMRLIGPHIPTVDLSLIHI